jgi:hypothetical protein
VLVGQLRTHLLRWDPIGVATVREAQDEYDCLISPIMHLLHDGAEEAEVRDWLVTELIDHFGMTPNPDRESALAGDLTAWWRRATSDSGQESAS